MTTTSRSFTLRLLPALIGLSLLHGPARAQEPERESLESLRQTTMQLIDALVANGILSRERADGLIRKAREGTVASTAPREPARTEPPAVRVPYVPQVVRDQIRDEVKKEVVAQAREERWGVPGMAPEWTERIRIDGDIRFRGQQDNYGKDNPTPQQFVEAARFLQYTRAPDLATVTGALEVPNANSQLDRDRLRLRARLGVTAQVAPTVTAGLRLATGSATDRVSTNQTLGQNFNRYTLLVDRAYIRIDPAKWFSLSAGRIANPWFSTDLVWSENLAFEGVATQMRWPAASGGIGFEPFATAGAFPIREQSPPRRGRWLYGLQAGFQWYDGQFTRVKFGVAQYQYKNLEGRQDNDYLQDPSNVNSYVAGATYGQYEYEAGLRQRGNTLFATNSVLDGSCLSGATVAGCKWGLVSKFRPFALTASAELGHFAPTWVMIAGEYVRNQGWDADEIAQRLGITPAQAQALGGRRHGFTLRTTLGMREIAREGDWQASVGYRWLGADAVLDAFTDSDYGLGGTNHKGYTLGFAYGIARNTSLGLRYLSTRSIDSPTVQPARGDTFKISTLQLDLNSRF